MANGWKSSYYRYRELFLNVSSLYKKRADLRAFLEIVLSIVAVIVFLIFALKPTALTIISLMQQIKEEKTVLSGLTQKISNLQKANTLLNQNQLYLNDIDTAISTSPSPDVFTKQIEGIAFKNGVTIIGFSINDVVLVGVTKTSKSAGDFTPFPENAQEMNYSVSVRGSFTNIESFLKDMENLRTISTTDSLTINSSVTDTGRVIVALVSGRVPYTQQ